MMALVLVAALSVGANSFAKDNNYLTDFRYGVSDGDSKRNFTLIINEDNNNIPITSSNTTSDKAVYFPAWTFNNTVPGPTLRMNEGDNVSITVINDKNNEHTHSLHMHSVHDPAMDGTFGPSGSIKPGENFTYTFIAGPSGVYPYHCHVEPVVDHINRGLYGAMIIDPQEKRAPAHEMVMMMNSYDLDLNEELQPTARVPDNNEANDIMYPSLEEIASGDDIETEAANEEDAEAEPELEIERDNEFYTVNGRAFEYMDKPIEIEVGELVRIYLLSMTEFDPVNSFHLHSGMFNYTASGTANTPPVTTDLVTLGQGDRGIVEFTPEHAGLMMIHAHVNEFTSLGWMAVLNAK